MKKILITILLIMSMLPAAAKTLTGGVVYTVESAREAAFEGIEYEISMEPFKKYMKDPGFIAAAKTEGGKPRVSKRGRWVTYFSDGSYCVTYSDKMYVYYYDNSGILGYIEINLRKNNIYPFITKKYDLNGRLVGVFFVVSKDESFVYTHDKKLVGHWINDTLYDEKGVIEGKRKSSKN